MAIYKGTQKIGEIYKGSTKIEKLYKGTVLLYSAGYWLTKTGYPVTLLNSLGKNLKDYKIYGNSSQRTSGKNLLPYPFVNTGTYTTNGVTYTDNGDGSVTISGTATGYSAFVFTSYLLINSFKTYTFSFNATDVDNIAFQVTEYDKDKKLIKSVVTAKLSEPYIYTPSTSSVTYITISIKRNYNNKTCSGTVKIQLEEGIEATEYEAYVQKPTLDNPSEIESLGIENLLPDNTSNLNDWIYISYRRYHYSLDEYIKGKGDVTLSFKHKLHDTIGTYDDEMGYFYLISSTDDFETYNTDKYFITGKKIEAFNYTLKVEENKKYRLFWYGEESLFENIYDIQIVKKGEYRIPVIVSGKNLLPYSYKGHSVTTVGVELSAENDVLTINGTATSTALLSFFNNLGIVEDITLSAGTYTISVQGTGTVTDNGNFLQVFKVDGGSLTNAGQIGLNKNLTFTLEKTQAIRLRVIVYSGRSYNATFNIQLEYGTTATEYEGYVEPKTTNIYLDEPLRKVGEYADYIDFNNKKLIRNVGKSVFDGSELWVAQSTGAYLLNHLQYRPSSAMCDKFIFEESTKTWTENGKFGWNSSGTLWCAENKYTSMAIWKKWLSENNMTVYYQLQTPTEESIDLPDIPTLKHTNIITTDTTINPSNMEIVYKSSKKEV